MNDHKRDIVSFNDSSMRRFGGSETCLRLSASRRNPGRLADAPRDLRERQGAVVEHGMRRRSRSDPGSSAGGLPEKQKGGSFSRLALRVSQRYLLDFVGSLSGGQGRNRTTDTRIFNAPPAPSRVPCLHETSCVIRYLHVARAQSTAVVLWQTAIRLPVFCQKLGLSPASWQSGS
jgi:hypothetical protein